MDLKLGGIVSGLDTQDIVSKLMLIEKQPMVLLENRKHEYELKKELWQEINTNLLALKTANEKLLSADDFKKRTVSSTDENIVTATADTAAAEANYSITVTNLAQNHQIRGSKMADTWVSGAGTFTLSDGTYSSTISISATDDLQHVADKINEAKDNTDSSKDLKITASIIDNTLVLSHDETGAGNNVTVTDDSSGIMQTLGVVNSSLVNLNVLQNPEDAQFTVNGMNITRSRNNSLNDVISGLTLDLKAESATAVTISVQKDLDTALNAVKDFIDKYNSTMDLINSKLSEKKVKDPLSDTDRKKGILKGSTILMNIKSTLRRNISDPVVGLSIANDRLSVIGITTIADDYGTSGKLQIDETKFREALASNPDEVIQLFTSNVDIDSDGNIGFDEKGVLTRIGEQLEALTSTSTTSAGGATVKKGIISNTIDSFDKTIKGFTEAIDAFEERLKVREKNLWAQFTAMEQALSTMNNQATWLAGQLNGLE